MFSSASNVFGRSRPVLQTEELMFFNHFKTFSFFPPSFRYSFYQSFIAVKTNLIKKVYLVKTTLLAILAVFCNHIVTTAMLFCCNGNCTAGSRPIPNLSVGGMA